MKPIEKPQKKELIQQKLTEIVSLYADSTLTVLINDTVAIGTWPTPEKPKFIIPLSEKAKKLKKLISDLIEIGAGESLTKLYK